MTPTFIIPAWLVKSPHSVSFENGSYLCTHSVPFEHNSYLGPHYFPFEHNRYLLCHSRINI